MTETMAKSRNFFEDVKKELECSVCQEQFSDINEPKILKCLHTFCKNCLEAWLRQQREGELSCPTCRQITECPNSNINRLPSNLFYKQMVEIVEAYSGRGQDDSATYCGICGERKSLKFYCSDCNCFLCEGCSGAHKKGKIFRGHHVKEIRNFDSSDVQDYVRKANICKKHKDELRYYCDKCKICICRDCAILEHQDHNKISLEQGLEKKKSGITIKIQEVEAVGCRLRSHKESLERRIVRVENSIDQATNEVHRVAEQFVSLIRQQEATMSKELLERKASCRAEFSTQMSGVDAKLIEIDNSLEFGKDVLGRSNLPEILNVEETLERRFQELLSSPKFIPDVINYAEVKFVPTDMSSIQDELGKLLITNTQPSFSIAQGKGLIEGIQGEDCTFTIITKDSQGETTYSEGDQVSVDIQSLQTGQVTKPSITDSKDGSYEVKYKLEDAEVFNVSITIGGEAIMGSPFQLEVKGRTTRSKKQGKGKRESSDLDYSPQADSQSKCDLCMYENGDVSRGCSLRHHFCHSCLKSLSGTSPYGCALCPCYGLKGDQPPGHMSWRTDSEHSLPGYEDCGTIVISCNFDRGVQGPEHPNPGVPYYCFFCTFYLPDNRAGRSLCIVLRVAFNSGWMFTVGAENSIICRDLTLKASRSGGPANCGYPDPDYLDLLKGQLARKGFVDHFL